MHAGVCFNVNQMIDNIFMTKNSLFEKVLPIIEHVLIIKMGTKDIC